MQIPSEEIYSSSPSSHIVPCSPFLYHKSRSPAPCVPDIDRLHRRKHDVRNHSILPSPLISTLRSSQADSQPQRLPFTPIITVTNTPLSKQVNNSSTPSLEQVVPNCSPSVMLDEKPQTVKGKGRKSKQKSVLDEKPPLPKRQNRNLKLIRSPEMKEIELFRKDDIFG